jgi:hypothetical protein
MVETGYRYTELYWAGRDRNWGYAEYQLGKIETAIANGLERRPKRAASAAALEGPVDDVRKAVAESDPAAFDVAFAALTEACNACHRAEGVGFVNVRPPRERVAPVGDGRRTCLSPSCTAGAMQGRTKREARIQDGHAV